MEHGPVIASTGIVPKNDEGAAPPPSTSTRLGRSFPFICTRFEKGSTLEEEEAAEDALETKDAEEDAAEAGGEELVGESVALDGGGASTQAWYPEEHEASFTVLVSSGLRLTNNSCLLPLPTRPAPAPKAPPVAVHSLAAYGDGALPAKAYARTAALVLVAFNTFCPSTRFQRKFTQYPGLRSTASSTPRAD